MDDTLRLLATAEDGTLSELQRAHVDLLRAETVFVVTRGRDAPPLLVEAARRLSALDPRLARETYLEALSAAMFAGRLAAAGAGVTDVAQAARAAPAPPDAPRAPDVLLDGLATLFSEATRLRCRSCEKRRGPSTPPACPCPTSCDGNGWRPSPPCTSGTTRAGRRSRSGTSSSPGDGALGELPLALMQRVYVHLFAAS